MKTIWLNLIDNVVFLSPDIVNKFHDRYGDAIVFPYAFRGRESDYNAQHNSGFPIFEDGRWYSLWGMRPSRNAVSVAIGLKKGELERRAFQNIECDNGKTISNKWTVHHVYECGLSKKSAKEKVRRFSNLSNLVLMTSSFHTSMSAFVHGDGEGARWMKWIISELYPRASRLIKNGAEKPAGSPNIDQINVSNSRTESLKLLMKMRNDEAAGNKPSTTRLKEIIPIKVGPVIKAFPL